MALSVGDIGSKQPSLHTHTHTHMHKQSAATMFVSLVLQGKLQITPRAASQRRGLPSTLTENKTTSVFGPTLVFVDVKLNSPESVFPMPFF